MRNEPIMYIVIRADLDMPPGKLAVQAGHAVEGALEECSKRMPHMVELYKYTELRKKICLKAENEEALMRAQKECERHDISTFLVEDAAITVFDGPTVTALGIGPLNKKERPDFLGRLRIY